ncbi:anti-sigma B factor antagonist [Vibrio albus]|uniref:Anti-sigma B factor antagonist n=1 Tax=Vibrio albus TaxID=2200953 RepID=A0A2U3B9Y3_9VIBR|nr:STAS domain-containing protein [Vibrio albus]PWI33591.1 anti-sigma B factor antagonist [Vibrio albus]
MQDTSAGGDRQNPPEQSPENNMGNVVTQQEATIKVSPGSEMTIYTASELKETLYKDWNHAREIEVDLSIVDELDSAGVQLLLQMKSDSEHARKPVRFVDHSPVVLEVLEMLNLIGRFADPIILPADNMETSA